MRAAIYVRVSTLQQAGEDRVSLPEQARELLVLAERKGWEVVTPPKQAAGVPDGGAGRGGADGGG